MCPNRTPTSHEEPIESSAPRCAIWWHLCVVFGLIAVALLGLGGGWLYNANLGRENRESVKVIESQMLERTKALEEIRGDLKELLRRSGSRVSTTDRDGDKG